ncbi:DUF1905 domain-containing protein [Parerythrobacter lacustris]|uniref:DUF1905 domain-containing protein n=1 Tax=Parerythrobacter lacustris TaxID=2969984 RepID=A0ABT1XN00_9SPHN|nr:DUF1905 domain-containing protein [Parerythrobacter lacustris]MCR2833034.1 DUF1905 domain-containing protein [Parerythrobacter lacustris]
MTERLQTGAVLQRWQGERGTYHLVTIGGETAEAIGMHERLRRLEFGARRGFGSVKVTARIGGTRWKTSVFPSKTGEWWLLVGKKVLRAEDLAEGDALNLTLELY